MKQIAYDGKEGGDKEWGGVYALYQESNFTIALSSAEFSINTASHYNKNTVQSATGAQCCEVMKIQPHWSLGKT